MIPVASRKSRGVVEVQGAQGAVIEADPSTSGTFGRHVELGLRNPFQKVLKEHEVERLRQHGPGHRDIRRSQKPCIDVQGFEEHLSAAVAEGGFEQVPEGGMISRHGRDRKSVV